MKLTSNDKTTNDLVKMESRKGKSWDSLSYHSHNQVDLIVIDITNYPKGP